jgi:hypothetical protein
VSYGSCQADAAPETPSNGPSAGVAIDGKGSLSASERCCQCETIGVTPSAGSRVPGSVLPASRRDGGRGDRLRRTLRRRAHDLGTRSSETPVAAVCWSTC